MLRNMQHRLSLQQGQVSENRADASATEYDGGRGNEEFVECREELKQKNYEAVAQPHAI